MSTSPHRVAALDDQADRLRAALGGGDRVLERFLAVGALADRDDLVAGAQRRVEGRRSPQHGGRSCLSLSTLKPSE